MEEHDPIIQCPYNDSHAILKSRMQGHIVKCKVNYPTADKKVCPFNAIHHVDRCDFENHCRTCPDRRLVETHLYQVDDGTGDLGITPFHNPELPETEENWDDVQTTSTYDPRKNLENQPIYRIPVGFSKAERKKFRMGERRRHERIMSGEFIESEPKSPDVSRPLRRPHDTSEALVEAEEATADTEGQSTSEVIRPLRRPHDTSQALVEAEEAEEATADTEGQSTSGVSRPLRRPHGTPQAFVEAEEAAIDSD